MNMDMVIVFAVLTLTVILFASDRLRLDVVALLALLGVTVVPYGNVAAQVAPQAMPAGSLVTVPLPLPAFVTLSV